MKKVLSTLLLITIILQMFAVVSFAENQAPTELTWIENDPGVLRFKVMDYTNQYSIHVYKNGEYVYHTYSYYDSDFDGGEGYKTEYDAKNSIAELGDGEYTFTVSAVTEELQEDGHFGVLATSEMSKPLVYKKMPEVAKATNIKLENNVISWSHNDSNVIRYELKLFYTYDGLDFYELGHWDADSLTSYTLTESDWEHYHKQTKMWDELYGDKYEIEKVRLAVQIYSIPADRTKLEMSATDCIFLTESSEQEQTGEYKKVISLTIGETVATVNGVQTPNDAPPKIINNRTMLPIRIIAENLGAKVGWNEESQTVDITKGDTKILITIDSAVAYVNGEAVNLDVTAFIEHQRTYLPVRFISETLGADVGWDPDTQTVTIKAK